MSENLKKGGMTHLLEHLVDVAGEGLFRLGAALAGLGDLLLALGGLLRSLGAGLGRHGECGRRLSE